MSLTIKIVPATMNHIAGPVSTFGPAAAGLSKASGEGKIRNAPIKADLANVAKLFYRKSPLFLWFSKKTPSSLTLQSVAGWLTY